MIELKVKPISVNQAYTGKRFKTDKLREFLLKVLWLLPKKLNVPAGSFYVIYEFGFSSKLSDYDGGIKNFQDILQHKYKFDDRTIIGGYIQKKLVPKGEEYIKFKFFGENSKNEFIETIKEIM